MKETLVILAAGMGSRYGGLKQMDSVGSNGESIIDFTIYDAIRAGFKKLVLIIRKEHEMAFEENLVKKLRPFIEVEYAFQDLNDIPDNVKVPEGREKPWGTTHALLACRNILKEDPFVICNADDYYGKEAFEKAYAYMHEDHDENEYAMVGYRIKNTLSLNGTVTRALCNEDENHHLNKIVETQGIQEVDGQVICLENDKTVPVDGNSLASMNFWIFNPSIMPLMKDLFENSIEEGIKNNPLKYEALLPSDVGRLINAGKCKVKVLSSDDKWFGVTYKEDKPSVVDSLQKFKDDGVYPFDLWKEK